MRRSLMILSLIGVFGLGYVVGTSGLMSASRLWAEDQAAKKESAEVKPAPPIQGISTETQTKIKAAHDALVAAADALKAENRYVVAGADVNAFSVLCGGLNAVQDLEGGQGVDPETFASLYAGAVTDDVKNKLTRDNKNQILYNGKLVQMYPISQIKRTMALRLQLAGIIPTAKPTEGK